MDECVMYIAAIRLPPGKLAAQVAHAAVACFRAAQTAGERQRILSTWWEGDGSSCQAKVVLKLEDAAALLAFAEAKGIPCAAIRDAGRTVVEAGTLTAVAIGPVLRSELGPWREMKLY